MQLLDDLIDRFLFIEDIIGVQAALDPDGEINDLGHGIDHFLIGFGL